MAALSSGMYMISAVVIGGISWVINQFYAMILILAKVDLFEQFTSLKDNIFAVMGLFMVFKLAFSVIQYIINPDKMSDNSVGVSKIIIKIVVCLALLGSYDAIFKVATRIQNIVIEEQVLEALIFGSASEDGKNVNDSVEKDGYSSDRKGRYLSFAIFAPFLKYNVAAFEDDVDEKQLAECVSPFMQAVADGPDVEYTPHQDECYKILTRPEVLHPDDLKVFEQALVDLKVSRALFKAVGSKYNKETVFEVDWFIAPIVGIICAVILVIICINVAIRALKLSFLRLIAPIPIIMYIDPNDKGVFKKWLNLTIKTYLDLFIRLLSFYFAIFVITRVIANQNYKLGGVDFIDYPLLYVFFMIGTLLFAFQLPKIISDLTGANTDGLSKGIKKGSSMLGAAGLGMAGGLVAGTVGGISRVRSNIKENGAKWWTPFAAIGTTLSGMATGGAGSMIRGAYNARNGGNAFSHATSGITATSQVRNANAIRVNGRRVRSNIPFASSIAASFGSMAGLNNVTSGQGVLKAHRRELDTNLRHENQNLQDLMYRRNDIIKAQDSMDRERGRTEDDIRLEMEKYDSLFVTGAATKTDDGDLAFKVGNESIELHNMTNKQFREVCKQQLKELDALKGKIDGEKFSNIKRQLETYAHNLTNEQFNSMKDNLHSMQSRLTSINAEYENISNAVAAFDSEIATTRANITDYERQIRVTDTNLQNLNKSINK